MKGDSVNATNPNAQLALELLERLAPIHGTSDVRERQRLVTVGGCAHLIPQIDWDGAALDYVAGLLGVLSADGQVTLVGYLAGLMGPVGLKLGPDDRPSLEALRARVTGLSTDEWAQAFPSGCFNDGRSTRTRLLQTLRAPVADFTGRADDVAALVAQFNQSGRGFEASATGSTLVSIVGIRGMGGIGKTEVALKVAESLHDKYPDAGLMFELQPGNIALTPEALLSEVIRTFRPELRLPDDLASLQGLYRDTLAGRRGLLLFDNAADAAQVRPLLPPPAGWVVFVTSRALFPLPGAHLHNLDLLPLADALALTTRLLSDGGRADLAAADLSQLVEACGRLPLALRLAAGFLTSYADWSLTDYLAALQAERLKHLVAPNEPSIQAVLASSITRLHQLDPTLADRWTQLAVFPAPFDRAAASAVWGELVDPSPDDICVWPVITSLSDAETRAAISVFVQQSLLSYEPSAATYTLHNLVRDYILFQSAALDEGANLAAARNRHAWHYLRVGSEADDLFLQGGCHTVEGLRAFRATWPHLLDAWRQLCNHSDLVTKRWLNIFPDATTHVLALEISPRDQIPLLEAAVHAARFLGDRRNESYHLGNLGNEHYELGEVRTAIDYLEQALAISREIRAKSTPGSASWEAACHGEGTALGSLGNASAARGDMRTAITYYEQALALSREICIASPYGSPTWAAARRNEGATLGNLGNELYRLGDAKAAIGYYEQALAINRESGERSGEGCNLSNLGNAYDTLGDIRTAVDYYEQALVIKREIGDRNGEGNTLCNLGVATENLGDVEAAIVYYEQALAISRETADRRGEGACLDHLGSAYCCLGQVRRAIEFHEDALAISQKIGDRHSECTCLGNLGEAYSALGEPHRAVQYYERAAVIAQEIGDGLSEGIHLASMGMIHLRLNDRTLARSHWQRAVAVLETIGSPRAATVRAWLANASEPADADSELCRHVVD